jgi:ATP-dependent DNA helicase RecQ
MLFGPGDLMTQRRLQPDNATTAAALAAIERYARAGRCRQAMLCAHFTGTDDHAICGSCDACVDPDVAPVEAPAAPPPAEALGDDARAIILAAAAAMTKPLGKVTLAKSLRRQLPGAKQPEIVATIEQLIRDRKLERRGQKYPTVWLAGRPVRGKSDDPARPRRSRGGAASDLARDLDRYRRKMARDLKWKSYMVFQQRVIAAIDQRRPASKEALARIAGLGPAKIDRFGDDILALVHRHASAG